MTGAGGVTPTLNSVTLAYLPQNSPPVLKSINVITQAAAVTQPVEYQEHAAALPPTA